MLAARAASALGAGLAVAMDRTGWSLRCDVGEEPSFVKGADEVRPFEVPGRLADGALAPADWRAICERTGLAGLDLGAVAIVAARS